MKQKMQAKETCVHPNNHRNISSHSCSQRSPQDKARRRAKESTQESDHPLRRRTQVFLVLESMCEIAEAMEKELFKQAHVRRCASAMFPSVLIRTSTIDNTAAFFKHGNVEGIS
jgi:hypothetical protein